MRNTIVRLVILLTLAGLTAPLSAAVLSLKEAVETAQAKNPDILSLQSQSESAQAKSLQVMSPTEPTFSLSFNDSRLLFGLSGAASTVYQISQPIGFPGKAFVNHSIYHEQSRALSLQMKSKKLAVANVVRGAYFNLALARKNLELNLDQKRSYERILEIAKRRYESGGITQVDLMISQNALYANLNDLADLQANEKSTLAQLNLLLGNAPDQPLEVEPLKAPALKPIDRETILNKMVENQPDIRAARTMRKAAENSYKLAWMSFLPDFQIVVGTTIYNVPSASPYNGGENLLHTYMAGIQFTIPIWSLFNEREGIISATKDRATAEANLNSQYLQSKTTFENTMQSLGAFDTKLKNFEAHILPLAEQTLSLALTNYSSGKIDYQALGDATAAWRTTKTTYYATLVSYLTTYYSLSQLTGEDMLDEL